MPIMSWPLSTMGQLWDWMGEGFWKPAQDARTSLLKPAAEQGRHTSFHGGLT